MNQDEWNKMTTSEQNDYLIEKYANLLDQLADDD